MFKGVKGIIALSGAAILVVAVALAGYMSSGSSSTSDTPGGEAGEHLRITLDPQGFQGTAREAYTVADKDPALLAQLHCYCGCDRTLGHKSLLDCFRDQHGSKCAICTGEAIDAEAMATRGAAVEQIRDTLRTRYAHGG